MDDPGQIITDFEKVFGEIVDHEVIKIILQECQWDAKSAHERLMDLTGIFQPLQPVPPSAPHFENLSWSNVASKESCSKFPEKSKDEIVSNPVESNEEIDRIKLVIEKKSKVMIILRGLPGSGKSTLSKSLNTIGVVLSTDDYFYDRSNNYNFNPQLLSEAHRWNLDRTKDSMFKCVSPIFIDNTNLQQWEFEPYINLAFKYNYYFDFLEPQTNWKYDCGQLYRKCIHHIPKKKIEEMKERFDVDITLDNMVKKFQNCFNDQNFYMKGESINQMDDINVNDIIEVKGNDRNSTESLCSEKQEECPTVTSDNKLSDQLFSSLVNNFNGLLQENIKSSDEQHTFNSCREVDENDEEMYKLCRNLENTLGLPVVSMANSEMRKEGIEYLKTKVSKSKYYDELSLKVSDVCNQPNVNLWSVDIDPQIKPITSTLNNNNCLKPPNNSVLNSKSAKKLGKKVNNDKVCLSVYDNFESEQTSGDSWGKESSNLFWEEDNDIECCNNILTTHTGAVPKRNVGGQEIRVLEKNENVRPMYRKHKYTQYVTSDYTSPPSSDSCILDCNSNSFIPGLFEMTVKPSAKLYVDKGCMTDDTNKKAVDDLEGLKMLITFFPHLPKNSLEDVFKKCGNDLDWAMNILIDGGYQLSEASDDKESNGSNDGLSSITEPSESSDDIDLVTDVKNSPKSKTGKHLENVFKFDQNSSPIRKKRPTKDAEISIILSDTVDDKVRRLTNKEFKNLNVSRLQKVQSESVKSNCINSENSSQASLDTIEKEECKSQYLSSEIDPIFASQLINLYGPVSSLKLESGFTKEDRKIVLPLEVCHLIHKYWSETLDGQFEQEKSILDKFIREDEELARKLQEEENKQNVNIPKEETDAFEVDPPIFFKEISDLEKAIQLSKAEIPNPTEGALSSMLTLQKLQEEFSHVDPSEVEEEYLVQSSNYSKTKSLLSYKYGPAKSISSVISPLKAQNSEAEENAAFDNDEDFGIEVVNPQVYRDEAQLHYKERKKALQKAQIASQRGLKSVASYYAQIGNLHHQKFKESNERASKKILDAVNNSKGPNTLDLHMLHVVEAVAETQKFLSERKRYMAKNKVKYLQLEIITGKGIHSIRGEARLKPAVEGFLKIEGYSFERLAGMFRLHLKDKKDS